MESEKVGGCVHACLRACVGRACVSAQCFTVELALNIFAYWFWPFFTGPSILYIKYSIIKYHTFSCWYWNFLLVRLSPPTADIYGNIHSNA